MSSDGEKPRITENILLEMAKEIKSRITENILLEMAKEIKPRITENILLEMVKEIVEKDDPKLFPTCPFQKKYIYFQNIEEEVFYAVKLEQSALMIKFTRSTSTSFDYFYYHDYIETSGEIFYNN